jgi:glycosyltransferase involved in cell wall biosynthesis
MPLVVLPEHGPLESDLTAAGVEVLIRPLAVIRRALATPGGVLRVSGAAMRDAVTLAGLIRRRRVALVHSNTSVVVGGASAARVCRVPHVWHVREIYARFPRLWPAYGRLLKLSGELVCISQATASQFGADARVRVIYDGLAVKPTALSREASRQRLALPHDAAVVAVVGRVSDWKGQDVMVRALADARLRQRHVIGVIAGEAWPGAEDRLQRVLALAQRLGVRERLRMVGFRDDIDTVYAAADVVAVPSTEPEPLGDVAIEAAACGAALVASGHGGLSEVVRDRETGRLVPPGDSVALAAVVAELIDDPAQRERLGGAARRDTTGRFAARRLVAELQDLYDSLLG